MTGLVTGLVTGQMMTGACHHLQWTYNVKITPHIRMTMTWCRQCREYRDRQRSQQLLTRGVTPLLITYLPVYCSDCRVRYWLCFMFYWRNYRSANYRSAIAFRWIPKTIPTLCTDIGDISDSLSFSFILVSLFYFYLRLECILGIMSWEIKIHCQQPKATWISGSHIVRLLMST